MLTPRLTDCKDCTNIPILLEEISCTISVVAKRLYNNTVFMLNQNIDTNVMFDLLNYQRILKYKYCNPDYAGEFTVEMIASKVRRYTSGCVSSCYTMTPLTNDCILAGSICISYPTTTSTTTTSTSSTSTTTSSTSTSSTSTTSTSTSTTSSSTSTSTSSTSTTSTSTSTTSTSTSSLTTTSSSTSTTTSSTSTSTTSTSTSTSSTSSTTSTTTTNAIVDNYGYLYNWYVVGDGRNIANTGWHVPSEVEMTNLRLFFDPIGGDFSNVAGGPMKATGTTYWESPNTGATNISNLDCRAHGIRNETGAFSQFKVSSILWNSHDNAISLGGVGNLSHDASNFFTGLHISTNKSAGAVIRLRKDTPTAGANYTIISNAYTGNNGVKYDSTIIDGYEWITSNLKETRYRNNDIIPLAQSDFDWTQAGTTETGVACYYVIP